MTYQLIWDEHAIDAATRFLKDDPKGLQQLLDAVDLLADDPPPTGTTEYGSRDVRRMHVGRYRVLYEIAEARTSIVIIHVGRLG